MFGENTAGLAVGAFNTNIGNGALKTDVGKNGYQEDLKVSQTPITLTGLTNARKYYKLIESEINEQGVRENYSYVTGRLDEEKFAGNDGCDYLEIVYKVIKANGDYQTNYHFYTGIELIDFARV